MTTLPPASLASPGLHGDSLEAGILLANSAFVNGTMGGVMGGAGGAGGGDVDLSDLDIQALMSMTMMGGSRGNDTDNPHFKDRLMYYLMGIGGSIVCCLGTIANALSVAVLTRRAMRSSTYMYLAALAICDSLVLFFTLLLILKDTKPPENSHQLDQFHAVLFPFVHPTAVVFQVTSIWLTLAFTVDRYIMICHPFKAEHMCRRSRARKVVIGIYVGGLLFNIPRYLEYYTKTEQFNFLVGNSSQVYKIYGIETTDIGKSGIFREVIHSWSYLIFVCGIPFFTLVILNAFLIRAVHLSRLKGKEINVREKHRNDTTIMLIGVIIIFLICQGPALVSRMIYAFKPGATKTTNVFTLNEVSNFLVILNSAINIVPYYLFGKKFRSEFWRLFCSCLFDKDELRRIVRSYSLSIDQRRVSQYNGMEMNGVDHHYPPHHHHHHIHNHQYTLSTSQLKLDYVDSTRLSATKLQQNSDRASETSLTATQLNSSPRQSSCQPQPDQEPSVSTPLIHSNGAASSAKEHPGWGSLDQHDPSIISSASLAPESGEKCNEGENLGESVTSSPPLLPPPSTPPRLPPPPSSPPVISHPPSSPPCLPPPPSSPPLLPTSNSSSLPHLSSSSSPFPLPPSPPSLSPVSSSIHPSLPSSFFSPPTSSSLPSVSPPSYTSVAEQANQT